MSTLPPAPDAPHPPQHSAPAPAPPEPAAEAPAAAIPRRALIALVAGLIGLAVTDGLRHVTELERRKLQAQARGVRTPTLEQLETQLDTAAADSQDRIRAKIAEEEERIAQRQARATAELDRHAQTAAADRYRDTWIAIFARCLVLLGAYGLAVSRVRHYQVAGLAMLALFVYALVSDVRLTVG